MSAPESPSEGFLLGKIEATVSGTAEDVRALRSEVGDSVKRITILEHKEAATFAERETMKAEYYKTIHKLSNAVMAHEAILTKMKPDSVTKSVDDLTALTNRLSGAWTVTKLVGSFLVALLFLTIGQVWMDHRAQLQLEAKVVSALPAPSQTPHR